jgi:Major royal jelly protein
MDKNGNLFFAMVAANAIGCWNINKPYGLQTIRNVAQNFETMQFISGMKVVKNKKNKEELWVVSCRFQVQSCSCV